MPRTARSTPAGFAFHVLNRGNHRAQVFPHDGDYQAFVDLLAKAAARFPIPILAFWTADNLPPVPRLPIGSAIVEVTTQPHTGCHKFKARLGADAIEFVNSPLGKQLHLRGLNAKVAQPGTLRAGDRVRKIWVGNEKPRSR
jgi:hypothetical protein